MSASINTTIRRAIVIWLVLAALVAAILASASTLASHAASGAGHPTLISPMCGNGGCSPDDGDLFGPDTTNAA
jgi:hypothetical protein